MKQDQHFMFNRLESLGISFPTAQALRRISMTLRRWFERECGDGNGCIERDEKTGKPYWLNANATYLVANDPRARTPIADKEAGARKRLANIMAGFPGLVAYVQGDCRGAALYILQKSDVKEGESLDSVYTRGVAVY